MAEPYRHALETHVVTNLELFRLSQEIRSVVIDAIYMGATDETWTRLTAVAGVLDEIRYQTQTVSSAIDDRSETERPPSPTGEGTPLSI